MPRFDGTGPFGTGPIGRGLGPCKQGRQNVGFLPRIGNWLGQFRRGGRGMGLSRGRGWGRGRGLGGGRWQWFNNWFGNQGQNTELDSQNKNSNQS